MMTTQELNEYIVNYIKYNKTNSAIMLTAPWGTGKSYYIKNELIPSLHQQSLSCVVVSLYGLKTLSEVSKSLYMEIRFKPRHKINETSSLTQVLGKSIIKGISSYFGVSLNIESDLQKLYKSINLTGKLIIFEDIERSNISIMEFMGYVNNLVEQDNIKVLLVANEDEIIKYKDGEAKTEEQKKADTFINKYTQNQHLPYTEEAEQYLKIKEKTISDTIKFSCDFMQAIKKIINEFNNQQLNQFVDDNSIKDICNIFKYYKIYNLRSFLFACQKTVDLLTLFPICPSSTFIKEFFYSNIGFALKFKDGTFPQWTGNDNLSFELGYKNYPLYRFSFEYITKQIKSKEKAQQAIIDFEKFKLYDKNRSREDSDLNIIYGYYLETEANVIDAITAIEKRLKNIEDISFFEYGKLASYIIAITEVIDYDISYIKDLLVKNLSGRGDNIEAYILFSVGCSDDNKEKQAEFLELKKRMEESLCVNKQISYDINLDNLSEFCEKVYNKRTEFADMGSFTKNLDINKMVNLLTQCTAKQIEDLRRTFLGVYSSININEFLAADKNDIDLLIEKITNLSSDTTFDAIQKLQIKWFIYNLHDISNKLSINWKPV